MNKYVHKNNFELGIDQTSMFSAKQLSKTLISNIKFQKIKQKAKTTNKDSIPKTTIKIIKITKTNTKDYKLVEDKLITKKT